MSLELVNTFATLGTFLVIAATAVAAIVQLRHMRSSNQIAVLNRLRETTDRPDFVEARKFSETQLTAKLQDPELRRQVAEPPAGTDEAQQLIAKTRMLGNFYEGMGIAVKAGLVDRELVLQVYSEMVTQTWEILAPYTALIRRRAGDSPWETFEYLAVLSQDWLVTHPKGTYPAGMRRMGLKDEWLEADRQYAASVAPA